MPKNEDMIIAGDDCEDCIYFVDTSEVNHKITCGARNKQYYYGQCIPCDDMKTRRKNESIKE